MQASYPDIFTDRNYGLGRDSIVAAHLGVGHHCRFLYSCELPEVWELQNGRTSDPGVLLALSYAPRSRPLLGS